MPESEQDGDESKSYEVVEAGTGGKKYGPFDTEQEAEDYVEERFGSSPAPATGRVIWKGERRPGRSRYILKLRPVLTDGGVRSTETIGHKSRKKVIGYGMAAALALGATIVGVSATETPIDVIIVGVGGLAHGFFAAQTMKEGLTL